jgi:hypothetical protein
VLPGDKRPIYRGWQQDATTDEKLVRQYFTADPSRNIGVVCGEMFDAWDIEAEHLPAVLGFLKEKQRGFPETPIARTGRGGLHLLTTPTGVDATRQLHFAGTHIGELKSTGGFIVLAPSRTVGQYRWEWATRGMRLEPALDWMLPLLEKPRATIHKFPDRLKDENAYLAVLERLSHAVLRAGEGRRNSYLYWAVRRALEEGVPVEETVAVLREAALEADLDQHETEATIRSAVDAEADEAA